MGSAAPLTHIFGPETGNMKQTKRQDPESVDDEHRKTSGANMRFSRSSPLSDKRPMRVLTMNIWNFCEPYEKRQSLLRRGLQELDPDLMAFQEAGFTDGRHQVADVLRGMGYHILHQFEVQSDPRGVNGLNTTRANGCCVASRWPMQFTELLSLDITEHTHGYAALAVRVAVPSPVGPLLFVSAVTSWELNREYERERQAVEIVKMVHRHARKGEFPPIIAGDFDAAPEAASVRFLTGKQSLDGMSVCFRDAWAEVGDGGPGYTWTTDNRHVREWVEAVMFEKRHARRIDYIFLGSFHDYPKYARISTCRVVLDRPTNGVWPSDHYAVHATIDVQPSPQECAAQQCQGAPAEERGKQGEIRKQGRQ